MENQIAINDFDQYSLYSVIKVTTILHYLCTRIVHIA